MTEHEELLILRTLIEKQKEELAVKDKTIEGQKAQIEKQNIQIENMIQALLHARKKLFGVSSEVIRQVNDYGTRFGHQEGSKHDFISAMRQAHRQYRIISEDKDFYGYGADSIRMIAMTYEVFE